MLLPATSLTAKPILVTSETQACKTSTWCWVADQSCSVSNTKSCANVARLSSDHKRNNLIAVNLNLLGVNSPESAVRCCFLSTGSSSTGGSRPLALAACRRRVNWSTE